MFNFPEWVQTYQVEDDAFATSYEATPASKRAWLKKTIAQVFAVNNPDAPLKSWTVNTWRGGFETEISLKPLDWTLLLIDESSLSPVQILAALVPAFAAGVNNTLVAYTGNNKISAPVLTSFELAGQEDVINIDSDKLNELIDELTDSPFTGVVLDMRQQPAPIKMGGNIRFWQAPHLSTIFICKDEDSPDIDVLEFAHPEIELTEINEDILESTSGEAIVVPAHLVGDVLDRFKIVLTHGQEGCWLWNDFDKSFFTQESVALTVTE